MTIANVTSTELTVVALDSTVDDAIDILERAGIDQAPIADEPITHCVELEELQRGVETVAEVVREIGASDIVSSSAGLAAVLPRFRNREYFYVLGHDHISGIATRADLQRPAVSMAVLSLVLSFETAIGQLVDTYSHGDWLDLLDRSRREDLENRYQQRRDANAEIGYLECLDLVDRFELILVMDHLREDLGFSRTKWKKLKKRVTDLRNTLAHGGSIIATRGDFEQTIDTIEQISDLTDHAWHLATDSAFVWASYIDSVITLDGHPYVATVRAAGEGETACAAGDNWESPTFVISADKTGGKRISEAEAKEATNRLMDELTELGASLWPAVGKSRLGSWSEASIACAGCTRWQLIGLAERFGQRAIFELTDDVMSVIDCRDGTVRGERTAIYTLR